MAVSSGYFHSLMVDRSGTIWGNGSNARGQLGLGHKEDSPAGYPIPLDIDLGSACSGLYCGGNFSFLRNETGEIFCFGSNNSGQLGIGKSRDQVTPIIVPNLPPIQCVSPYYDLTLLLDEEGYVYSSGYNGTGQLGHGDTTKRNQFEKLPEMPLVAEISAGLSHSLFLDRSGYVWGTGWNSSGQLGLGETDKVLTPKLIPGLPIVNQISAGRTHSLFLDERGVVWGTGSNLEGELGNMKSGTIRNVIPVSEGLPRIIHVLAKHKKSFLIDCEGCVWVAGMNSNGELGIGYEKSDSQRNEWNKIKDLPPIVSICSETNNTKLFGANGEEMWICGLSDNFPMLGKTSFFCPQPVELEILATKNSLFNSWQIPNIFGKSLQKSARNN